MGECGHGGMCAGHQWKSFDYSPVTSRQVPYSGYFLRGKIFMVFVVERRTTKFVPTKQYRIVPGCGLVVYTTTTKRFSMNWPKIHCSQKFYPTKNTCYTVCNFVSD